MPLPCQRTSTGNSYDIVRIARDVAAALAEAHAQGIVHRDIKPDNVMVAGSRVKVLDFGIAKQTGEAARGQVSDRSRHGDRHDESMSPEQALGKALDARSDIFSLCVALYQALDGTWPFHGNTATELLPASAATSRSRSAACGPTCRMSWPR